jgi:hypothetical protein
MNNIRNFGEFLFEKNKVEEEKKDKKEKCPDCGKKMKKCTCSKDEDKKDDEKE